MSREFLHILTDPGDGDLEFDTSVDVGDLAVDLDGSPAGLSFTQVNDGYYFEYTVSGSYTLSISGVDQDEYTDMPLVADEDNVTTQMFQSVDGYIYLSGGYARVYTGGNKNLHAGDIVDDDTTGGSAVPASAEIVKTLGAEIDILNNRFAAGDTPSVGGGGNIHEVEIIEPIWIGPVDIADGSDGGVSGDDEDKTQYLWQTTSESYEEKLRLSLLKTRNRNSMILQAAPSPVGSPGASYGNVKLEITGTTSGEVSSAESSDLLDTHGFFVLVADVSNMLEGEQMDVTISIKVKAGEADSFGLTMGDCRIQGSSYKQAKAKNVLYSKVVN